VEKIGWVDPTTFAVVTIERSSGARRLYLFDRDTGSLLQTIPTAHRVFGIFATSGGYAQMLSVDATVFPQKFTFRSISRNGLGEPLEVGQVTGGPGPSGDGTGVVWVIDGEPTVLRQVNGRLQKEPLTASDQSALARIGQPGLKAMSTPLSPSGTRLTLIPSLHLPLQPSEYLVGVGDVGVQKVAPTRSGVVYELDSCLFGRAILELRGQAAERQQDAEETKVLQRWARAVLSEFQSWRNAVTPLPAFSEFPVETVTGVKEFQQRLRWQPDGKTLFAIVGERLRLTATDDGKTAIQRR
jgi:hypothetical protein